MPLEILRVLKQALDVELPSSTAGHVLREIEHEIPGRWDEVWQQRWLGMAPRLGLAALPMRESLGELLELVRPDAALLVRSSAALSPSWFVITAVQGNAVRVYDSSARAAPRWLGLSALQEQCASLEQNAAVEAILFRPSMPCQPASVAASAHVEHAAHGSAHARGTDASPHGHEQHGHGLAPWRRLLSILRSDRRDIWLIVCYGIGISILMLATPITIEALVTSVAYGSVLQPLLVLSLVLLGCLMFAAVLRALQTFFVEILQRRILARVAADLAQRLPRVSVSEYDRNHGPELVNRFFDVLTLQKICAALLMDGVMIVLQTTIGMLVVAFYHPLLLGLDLVLLGLIAFIIFGLGRGAVSATIQESIAKYRVVEWLQELARHPVTFKMGGGAAYALGRTEDLTADYLRQRDTAFGILFRQIIASLMLQALASTALLSVGGWLVIGGSLTLGQLIAAELILSAVVASFVKFGKHLENYYDLMAATDKLGHLLDLELEVSGSETPPASNQPARLTVQQLSFGYHPGRPVLSGLDFDLLPGERVAIQSGGSRGHTTLTELLYGLRRPEHGRILLDGADYRELRGEALREQIAIVSRNEIFDGSIAENLRMGREFIRNDDLRHALEQVGLLEDFARLDQGWETALTTGGAPLSTRQILRLMLARAMLGRPRLLILDETLDAFSPAAAESLRQVLFDPQTSWTLLLITERPDLLRHCDRVLSFDAPNASAVARPSNDSPSPGHK